MAGGFQQKLQRFFYAGLGGVLGAGGRIELYETLELLLTNQVRLAHALREIYKIESKDGKKKNEVRAVVLYECIQSLESGRSLGDALGRWVPDQEAQLIRAGERSGNLVGAFKDATRIIEAKQKIVGAVAGGAIYPLLLMGMVCLLLYQIATKMVPQFAMIVTPEKWTGAAAILDVIASLVINYGVYALGFITILFIWIGWSLPNMSRSRVRNFLDRIPPWSIYRMLHGSTFLLNIAVMLRAGIRVQEILIMMGKNGSPWLKSRINGALSGINQGANLGWALHRSGYNFPDPRAVQFLRILADQDGFDSKLSNFGERWLDKSVANIQSASKIFLILGVLCAGGLIILILAGVMSIQSIAQSSLT